MIVRASAGVRVDVGLITNKNAVVNLGDRLHMKDSFSGCLIVIARVSGCESVNLIVSITVGMNVVTVVTVSVIVNVS